MYERGAVLCAAMGISRGLRMAGTIRKASEIAGSRIMAKTICSKVDSRKVAVTQNVNEIKGLHDDDSTTCQSMIERLMEKMDHLTNIVNGLSRNTAATKKALSERNFRPMPWESDMASALQRIFYLEWKLEAIEKGLRRNTIMISGLEICKTNIREYVRGFLNDTFQVSVTVERAQLLERPEKPSLIIVTLGNIEDKNRIIAMRAILKGSGIYINSRETTYDKDVRQQLKLIAKDETEKGRMVNVRYRKLIVDGVEYIWEHGTGLQKSPKKH